MEQLYINDIEVDLIPKSVSQTAQINDIAELEDRQTNRTNNIKMPKTAKNIAAFDFLGVSGNKSTKPYTRCKVKYVVDGIELITDGYGVVRNTNQYYNLVIYDGNKDLSELLNNETLNNIDFTSYNHDLTVDNWFNSFSKTDGYIYGLGKFYENATTSIIDISLQNVSFYLHTLFEMIFTQKGYTVSGDIFSNEDYLSRVISMKRGHGLNPTSETTQIYNNIVSNYFVNETFSVPTNKEYLTNSYTVLNGGVNRITIDGDIFKSEGTNHEIRIYINGEFLVFEAVPDGDFIITKDIQVLVGDLVEIKIYVESVDDSGSHKINFLANYVVNVLYDNLKIPIKIEELIGDSKQLDLVKDVMQRFGLMFRKVRNKKEFEFIQMSKLLNDFENAEDWSDIYDAFISEDYTSSYGQINYGKYEYDEDNNNSYADGSFLIDNVNLSDDNTLFTSIFKDSKIYKGYNVLNHWVEDSDDLVVVNEDSIRMFKVNVVSDTIYFRYNNEIETTAKKTTDYAFLDFQSIYYQNELDNNYKEVAVVLNTFNKKTISVNLNLLQYYALDFFKLKYFSQLGGMYYLNKVSNFKKGQKTKIEIIKSINGTES